jgi:hypothetical protein
MKKFLRISLFGFALFANALVYSQISRASLINLNPEEQKVTFIALPNNEKFSLFISKLNDLKNSNYFSAQEIVFIDGIVSEVSSNIYTSPPAETYIVNKKNDALTTLGWSEIKWKVIFETLYTPEEFNQKFLVVSNEGSENVVGGGSGSEGVCHCKWSLICPANSLCNAKSDCSVPGGGGCGWFWKDECTGRCDNNLSAGGNSGFKDSGYTLEV